MEVGKMKRLTISLDNDTVAKLEELAKRDGRSLSEVARVAISSYYDLILKNVISDIKGLIDLISTRDYIAMDIGLWAAILDELCEKASESFWDVVEKVGFEHGLQFKEMGLEDLYSVIKLLEASNWFNVRTVSEDVYVITLVTRNEGKLVRRFFDGLFKSMGFNVEVSEGLRKLILKKRV
jgi:hypothetical protein